MNRRQIEHFYLLSLALDTAMDATHAAREFLSEDSAGAAARSERKAAAYSVLIERLEAVGGLSGVEDSELRLLDSDITNGDVESAGRLRRRILENRVREFARGDKVDEVIHQLYNQIVELNQVVSTLREVRGR